MDRGSGDNFPRRKMNVGTLVAGALGRHAAKKIETGIGCSPRQAWRIIETGRVPGRLRSALLRFLDASIAKNKQALDRLHDELKALDLEEMLARAGDRRQDLADQAQAALPGLDQRTAEPFPVVSPAARRVRR